jgi:hypothetical protein
MKKLTIEEVKQRFIEKKYTLLSTEYTGSKQKLQYICKCGNISMISIIDLSRHKGCMKCSGSLKYTIQEAKRIFLEKNCTLLEDEYISNGVKMKYKCNDCEINHSVSLASFIKQIHSCENCRITLHRKIMFNRIKKEFQENNCELLETEYINNHTVMKYKCNCKNISKISYNAFQSGRRCMKCSGTPKYSYDYVKNYF